VKMRVAKGRLKSFLKGLPAPGKGYLQTINRNVIINTN
jgi:hypothetical protein